MLQLGFDATCSVHIYVIDHQRSFLMDMSESGQHTSADAFDNFLWAFYLLGRVHNKAACLPAPVALAVLKAAAVLRDG